MPRVIGRDEVQRLVLDERAQVAEVLPAAEYRWAHLPDALHLPLGEIGAGTSVALDARRPVIVYCNDFL